LSASTRGFLHAREFALHVRGQLVRAADRVQPHLLLDEVVQLALEEEIEQAHQAGHFLRGAFPVFRRERVKREVAHAQLAGGVDDGADRLHAPPVTFEPGQPARLRPTAIAVHDDGDVLRSLARPGSTH
jgi:hypothetical protein